jgi:cytochrome c
MSTRIPALVAVLAALADPSIAVAADDAGKTAFNVHCRTCHSYKKGDNRLGPSLYGIVGAEAGQVKGYNAYSGALTGFTWDEAVLDKFIASPTSVAPNTNMNYPPVADAAIRKNIIEFLKSTNAP